MLSDFWPFQDMISQNCVHFVLSISGIILLESYTSVTRTRWKMVGISDD